MARSAPFLGAAGLLDGLNAMTHWQYSAELVERFPAAKVVPDQIYVQDGALYPSAGVTAGDRSRVEADRR